MKKNQIKSESGFLPKGLPQEITQDDLKIASEMLRMRKGGWFRDERHQVLYLVDDQE